MKNQIHILLVDDDKYFRMATKELLAGEAIFSEAETEAQALDLISSNFFDVALIDMDIDGPKSGIKILNHLKYKKIHSIILSSQNDAETIEEAYNSGCDHFLTKLHYRSHLLDYIHKFKKKLFDNDSNKLFTESYITQDQKLQGQIEELCSINLKNRSILITGETGIGKSLIGKLLHEQTYNESQPFVHLNCSEISSTLIESELFGHKKGSFTGALNDKMGKLEQANGGTLFLDEIGTMPLSMQQKLLKALDQKTFYPVGSNQEVRSEFTLITATCDDLFELIHQEKFRKDLFFRISGINLHINPLRERINDIPLLINYFLSQAARRIIIKPEAITKLQNYDWPGNIRELKKYIDLLTVKNKGIIEANDISFQHLGGKIQQNSYLTDHQKNYIEAFGLREFIKKIEEESIQSSMERHKGKITHVIKELRISASAFYRIFDNIKTSF